MAQVTENSLESRQQIVEICRRLHGRNMLAAADGNVSLRQPDGTLLMTPSGRPKGFITADDMATLTVDGEILSGKPSAERLMHLEVYNSRPDCGAVVHAHPPTAIAWSLAYPDLKTLPSNALPEVILACGEIPIVPYARPTTEAMGTVLKDYLGNHKVMILARHGALSWGETLEEAYMGMERVEHIAQILKTASELKALPSLELAKLPASELEALYVLRKQIGLKNL